MGEGHSTESASERTSGTRAPKVFLSYRRNDSIYASDFIYQALVEEFGEKNVFKDVDTIPPGRDFREVLRDWVDVCDAFLAVIGDHWLDRDEQGKRRIDDPTDFVRIETELALARSIPVIPVLVGPTRVPRADELPEELRPLAFRQAVTVRPGHDFRGDIQRLVRGLRQECPDEPPGAGAEEALVLGGGVTMQLVRIKPGRFLMGSPASEADRYDIEGPQHEVEITRSFCLGKHLVTQAQYGRVMGTNPSHFGGEGRPAEMVSWYDAAEFCRRLSQLARWDVRLPTEAEWEYACRAGTTTPFHLGSSLGSDRANFDWRYPYGSAATGPPREETTPVGSFPANPWGLCDMHGNLSEWCADSYDTDYYASSPRKDPTGPEPGPRRILRGGSWRCRGYDCRSASRKAWWPGERRDEFGLRIVAAPSR